MRSHHKVEAIYGRCRCNRVHLRRTRRTSKVSSANSFRTVNFSVAVVINLGALINIGACEFVTRIASVTSTVIGTSCIGAVSVSVTEISIEITLVDDRTVETVFGQP